MGKSKQSELSSDNDFRRKEVVHRKIKFTKCNANANDSKIFDEVTGSILLHIVVSAAQKHLQEIIANELNGDDGLHILNDDRKLPQEIFKHIISECLARLIFDFFQAHIQNPFQTPAPNAKYERLSFTCEEYNILNQIYTNGEFENPQELMITNQIIERLYQRCYFNYLYDTILSKNINDYNTDEGEAEFFNRAYDEAIKLYYKKFPISANNTKRKTIEEKFLPNGKKVHLTPNKIACLQRELFPDISTKNKKRKREENSTKIESPRKKRRIDELEPMSGIEPPTC